MRINARLDENHARKLNYLLETTHSSTSEIIKQAIDVYYAQVRQSRPEAEDILQTSGFIGCGEASPDLAENYKEALEEVLGNKHDHRWYRFLAGPGQPPR